MRDPAVLGTGSGVVSFTTVDPAGVHRAQYSGDLIDLFATLLEPHTRIHDPFAGPGVRLGALADRLALEFSGTEIEPSFISDLRVQPGDATDISTYPLLPYTVVTSPAYGNGMSDGFIPRDTSERNTYTAWVGKLEGEIRHLAHNNQGRWGYRGRGPRSKARFNYWRIAQWAVNCWWLTPCNRVLLNIKDWSSGGKVEPFADDWAALLERHGFIVVRRFNVETNGLPSGSNHKIRTEHEVVLDARKKLSQLTEIQGN